MQKTQIPVYSYSQLLFKKQGDIAGNSHKAAIIPGLVANVYILELGRENKEQDGIEMTMLHNQAKATDNAANGVTITDVVSRYEALNLKELNMLIDIPIREEFGLIGVK